MMQCWDMTMLYDMVVLLKLRDVNESKFKINIIAVR